MLMSLLRLPRIAALLVPAACVFVGCMSSSSPTSGTGGEGGKTFFSAPGPTSTASGPGGPSSTSGSPDTGTLDPPHHCTGDAGAWEQLTAGPIPCQSGEECCVIVDPCLSESQVVAAANEKAASAAWPSCAVDCTDCIARAIEVACVAGSCLGRVIEDASLSSPLRKDHCGTALEFLDTKGGPTAVHFSCGPGPGP